MIRIVDLLALLTIAVVVYAFAFGRGAASMEAKVPVCTSYSQSAASQAIDVLLPHPGEAYPNEDGE